jgi:hypothetical protein
LASSRKILREKKEERGKERMEKQKRGNEMTTYQTLSNYFFVGMRE